MAKDTFTTYALIADYGVNMTSPYNIRYVQIQSLLPIIYDYYNGLAKLMFATLLTFIGVCVYIGITYGPRIISTWYRQDGGSCFA